MRLKSARSCKAMKADRDRLQNIGGSASLITGTFDK